MAPIVGIVDSVAFEKLDTTEDNSGDSIVCRNYELGNGVNYWHGYSVTAL